MKTKETTSVNSPIRQTLQEPERTRTTIPFQTPRLGGQNQISPSTIPAARPEITPSPRRNAHRNARISSTHFPSSHLPHPYPRTHVARRVAPPRSPARPTLIQSNGSRIPATEFPTIGRSRDRPTTPTNHASRSRVRRPRAGFRRGLSSTIATPVVSSPEPVAGVVNRPKSTSIGSSTTQHHARGIQSRNPKFLGRSFASIDIHPRARAMETKRKKIKRNVNPRAGPSSSSSSSLRTIFTNSESWNAVRASARAQSVSKRCTISHQLMFFTTHPVQNSFIRHSVPTFGPDTRVRMTQSAFA